MDEKIKITLIRKVEGDEKAASRLAKTLSAFAELKEVSATSWDSLAENESAISESKMTFIDLSLLPADSDESRITNLPKNITVFASAFPDTQSVAATSGLKTLLSLRNCLFLDELTTPDLLRVLHVYLLPKRQGGITALMEKGAVILGEKIQSLENIGEILDRLTQFFQEQLPTTVPRFQDLRQVATALFHEAFARAKEAGQPYPTLDFQVSASREKIVFFLRFPLGSLNTLTLSEKMIQADLLSWNLAWRGSDYLIITEQKDLKEVEVTSIIQATSTYNAKRFPSCLFTSKEHGSKAENLLSAPKNYKFSLISELSFRRLDANKYTVTSSLASLESELGSEPMPEKLKLKIQQMEQERTNLHELVQNREANARDLQARLNKATMEVVQKRNEILKTLKDSEANLSQYRRKIAELEKKSAFLTESLTEAQGKMNSSQNSEAATKRLEGVIKTLEREKTIIQDKLNQEQKRSTLFEEKFATLHKDLAEKEKQISDLRSALLKAQQTQAAPAHKNEPHASAPSSMADAIKAANATNLGSGDKDLSTKLKEAETRETALKQEVKKLSYKIEQSEKSLKATQLETTEKAKLLERKLEAAKTKEIELLKKIDELTALLKKATKVA